MASFDKISEGTLNMIGETLFDNSIGNLSELTRGMVLELTSVDIGNLKNFNLMNYEYMKIHMIRNLYEKQITLNHIGENAYPDGNPEQEATPAQKPSYVRGNNYTEFVTNVHDSETRGQITTRVSNMDDVNKSNLFNVTNLYFDSDVEFNEDKPSIGGNPTRSGLIDFSGDYTDKNSILYKTKKLVNSNKLRTIISKFHTDGVHYNGQIGSKYGESHGRNLLTKSAENGQNGYSVNGFDNPYCRVWTHHYQYDRLSRTMRADNGDMNTWVNFEWNPDTDTGHGVDNTNYGDGEKYDYAWRGHHNQQRRKLYSVLDTDTGLVKMTPQYRGGESKNRHTKECMFSIENLAWKDYDPYSFEQALSWEQRGPFGGRIMWFPPYGITITETASARWNSNDFIGRGEPVYTYVNSERTGNLSFIMLTDHPSIIDYASWWDGSGVNTGEKTDTNSENDYLRYFAGCTNGKTNSNTDADTVSLNLKPTPMTDEYTIENITLIKGKEVVPPKAPEIIEEDTPPVDVPPEVKNPIEIEFFAFYPNNYSGIMDAPTKQDIMVNSIAYLLCGRNAQKNGDIDSDLTLDTAFDYNDDQFIGYEMGKANGVSTDDCVAKKEYIQGGDAGAKKYTPVSWKKWCYRIDHVQPYTIGEHNGTNTINQTIMAVNMKDTASNKFNLDVSNNQRVLEMAKNKDNVYSLAEVAAAFYSENVMNKPNLYKYLMDCGLNEDRVKYLIDIFSSEEWTLADMKCNGIASSHGRASTAQLNKLRNSALANNRAKNIVNWLRTKWPDVNNSTPEGSNDVRQVDACDKKNVSGTSAKLYRSAHCVLTFNPVEIKAETQTDPPVEPQEDEPTEPSKYQAKEYVGFTFLNSELKENGVVWNYYSLNPTIKYYEQEAQYNDNYDDTKSTDDVTVTKEQILNIFKTFKPSKKVIINKNPNYRGIYSTLGRYIDTFDYSNGDPDIKEFQNNIPYTKDEFVIYMNTLYRALEDYSGVWDDTKFKDVTYLLEWYYYDDIVFYDGAYYKSKTDFMDKYDYDNPGEVIPFSTSDWILLTEDKTSEYTFSWELANLVKKSASLLCMSVDDFLKEIVGDAVVNPIPLDYNDDYSCIWKYGIIDALYDSINESTQLVAYAIDCETNKTGLAISQDEDEYLTLMINEHVTTIVSLPVLRVYIILYRMLDGINKVKYGEEVRDVCDASDTNNETMVEKTEVVDHGEDEECCENIWVDRGDGLLIQKCNIGKGPKIKSRFNAETGEGDWNKLRYDQEYHFYKQYMKDHPLVFDKLQEKIKYFDPAFHSMTPEGFNARLTFLHQCTRQGNTKTMSDRGGKTANNLAFGRPPYCILRLGDFYNQMIVIDNITFDYNVSNGLQWDLNTEGNGVQPMLCQVNIGFKFIGGGDITGPVQRLQNAMSFNYYANTSFYDNRADRAEYQDTNWKTMGGAGNNQIDYDKSYAFTASRYDDTGTTIITNE